MRLEDRPTPETDAKVKEMASGGDWDDFLQSDFSRDLEPKLNYAIEYGNRCVAELNSEIDEAAKIIFCLANYADKVAENHPKLVTIRGQNARAKAGLWLASHNQTTVK
jgi:hypothetical protein